MRLTPARWDLAAALRIAALSAVGFAGVCLYLRPDPASGPPQALAATVSLPFTFTQLARVRSPTAMVAAPRAGGGQRIVVAEQAGAIVAFDVDAAGVAAAPQTVLTVPGVASGGETGLLGIALAPGWPADPRAFVNYTVAEGDTGLSTVVASVPLPELGSVADGAVRAEIHEVLRFEQPYSNHNSGAMVFGPDGMLYIGVGDGGSGGDPEGHGQDMGDWLGSILRIDVVGASPYRVPADNPFVGRAGVLPEIWAYGVRNPWGMHVDRGGDHALWFADVGQGTYEEVNRGVAGANYGWNTREGLHPYGRTSVTARGFVDPLAEYTHEVGVSVTGGVVCRDPRLPTLAGAYLYADFGTGVFFGLPTGGGGAPLGPSQLHPSTFADDAAGHVYVADYGGVVYRIDPAR